MKKILLFVLAISVIALYSCRKDGSPKPIPPLDSSILGQDIIVNIPNTDNYDSANLDRWELIINEPSGKVLLDSVALANTNISAQVHTDALLVDVTFIYYSGVSNNYSTYTYLNVNPRTWTGMPSPGSIFDISIDILNPIPTTPTVYYIHPPAIADINNSSITSVTVSDYLYAYGSTNINYQPADPAYQPGGLLAVSYEHYTNGPVYTSFPQLGLYNFHQPPAAGDDTVDLSHMDTAALVTYNTPSGFTKEVCNLSAFMDTTDLDKSMALSINLYTSGYPADLEVPAKGPQAYQMELSAYNNSTSEFLTYSSYGPKVASSVNWFTAADYTLSASLQDSFLLSFPAAKPLFYRADYVSGNNYFSIYSAPDGKVLHPYTFFTQLGSKLLQGQNLSSLAADYFFIEQEQQLAADYNGLMRYYATTPFSFRYPSGSAVTTYQAPIPLTSRPFAQSQSTRSFHLGHVGRILK